MVRIKRNNTDRSGMTLIETVVGIAVFGIIAAGTYQALWSVQGIVYQANAMLAATGLANEQVERIRALPYEDVGIVGGFPAGAVEREQTFVRSGWTFEAITTIRNIDDPQFGVEGAANYKLVHIDVTCEDCRSFPPVSVTTYVAPPGLEETPGGGLLIQVFNATGDPLSGAQVTVVNNDADPSFTINDTTDNDGILRLIGVPEGIEAYEITVHGDGYSASRTYSDSEFENDSVPEKPHATVITGHVTAVSFAIDELSVLNVVTRDEFCNAVSSVPFTLSGSKKIALNPTVLKYFKDHQTDTSGNSTLYDMEWDDYYMYPTGSVWSFAGAIPFLPFSLSPGITDDITYIAREHDVNELLVTVTDAGTGEALSGVNVILSDSVNQFERTTQEAMLSQSDWSGGSVQPGLYVQEESYWQKTGGIVDDSPSGTITLNETGEGTLTSSIFDVGAPASFSTIDWDADTPSGTTARFQLATRSSSEAGEEYWNFVGPDGTSGSYYDELNKDIADVHNDDRFFRYRVYMNTNDSEVFPVVSNVSVAFSSSCVPPGQAFFQGLDLQSYTIAVSHDGYVDMQDNVVIDDSWRRYDVALQPE